MKEEKIKEIHQKVEEDLAYMLDIMETNRPWLELTDDALYASWLMGSVLSFSPSGKYYMPWTTNQTAEDVAEDELYWDTLRDRLEETADGLWLEQGEGDALDVFLCKNLLDEPWISSMFYEEEQTLLAFADGGYPVAYLDEDHSPLCASCATELLLDGGKLVALHTNYEDKLLFCVQCGAQIPAAYE